MTISVVPDIASSPPRNRVTVSVPAGSIMSSVSAWRNQGGVKMLLLQQPAAGFDSRLVDDFVCPYGQAVTYGWSSVYFDPSALVTVFNELWASTAAWTQTGGWSVSGGTVSNTSSGVGTLYRDFPDALQRITIGSLGTVSGGNPRVRITQNGGPSTSFVVQLTAGTSVISVATNTVGVTATTISKNSPITIDMGASSVTVSGTGGSITLPYAATPVGRIWLYPAGAGLMRFGSVLVQTYGAPATVTEESAPVSLTPDKMWLVHPAAPAASVPISQRDMTFATLTELGDVTNESNATVHKILGQAIPVTTTNGARAADQSSIAIRTYTAAQEAAVVALLADEVPILVNTPPSFGANFKCAFYQVGQVQRSRTVPGTRSLLREVLLPLLEVQSPLVTQGNTGWSYAALAGVEPSYSQLRSDYSSYANLQANIRS